MINDRAEMQIEQLTSLSFVRKPTSKYKKFKVSIIKAGWPKVRDFVTISPQPYDSSPVWELPDELLGVCERPRLAHYWIFNSTSRIWSKNFPINQYVNAMLNECKKCDLVMKDQTLVSSKGITQVSTEADRPCLIIWAGAENWSLRHTTKKTYENLF